MARHRCTDGRSPSPPPGNPTLRTGTGAAWRQEGRTLTANTPTDIPLAPDSSARLSFTADYTGANGLPTAFRVGDDVCTSTVVGPARTPVAPTSRPSSVGTGTGTAPAAPTAKKAVKAGKDGKPAKPANQKADKPPKKAKPASKDKGKG